MVLALHTVVEVVVTALRLLRILQACTKWWKAPFEGDSDHQGGSRSSLEPDELIPSRRWRFLTNHHLSSDKCESRYSCLHSNRKFFYLLIDSHDSYGKMRKGTFHAQDQESNHDHRNRRCYNASCSGWRSDMPVFGTSFSSGCLEESFAWRDDIPRIRGCSGGDYEHFESLQGAEEWLLICKCWTACVDYGSSFRSGFCLYRWSRSIRSKQALCSIQNLESRLLETRHPLKRPLMV